jgi:hypothetical protein
MAFTFTDTFNKWYERPSTQAAKRTHHTMIDQFGREWQTTLDITAKPKAAPCGPVTPMGWHDPLSTPEHVKMFDPAQMFRITIDVDRWAKEWAEANAEWDRRLVGEAIRMSPADDGAALLGGGGKDISPVLLEKIGAKPQPVEFVLALKGGNQWAAGKSDRVPAWANPLLGRMKINTGWIQQAAPFLNDLDKLKEMFPDADDERIAASDGGSPAAVQKNKGGRPRKTTTVPNEYPDDVAV